MKFAKYENKWCFSCNCCCCCKNGVNLSVVEIFDVNSSRLLTEKTEKTEKSYTQEMSSITRKLTDVEIIQGEWVASVCINIIFFIIIS